MSVVTLCVTVSSVIMSSIIMSSVIMSSVVMLQVITLTDIMLSVVSLLQHHTTFQNSVFPLFLFIVCLVFPPNGNLAENQLKFSSRKMKSNKRRLLLKCPSTNKTRTILNCLTICQPDIGSFTLQRNSRYVCVFNEKKYFFLFIKTH
jgi:uncharacterized membrane protein